MKKYHWPVWMVGMLLTFSACTQAAPEGPDDTDKIAPLIILAYDEQDVSIAQGENLDLLRGITGLDNVEGNITARIVIDVGNFDPEVPGTYTIRYTLQDQAGNDAIPVTRTITVRQTRVYPEPPIFTGTITDEQPVPAAPACFPGAWYHKVFSARDAWRGLEGILTLPAVQIKRYDGAFDETLAVDPHVKNLDNPSIYIGGHALAESDVGLSFMGTCLGLSCRLPGYQLSRSSMAFRPFWRYIAKDNLDEGSYADHDNLYGVSCYSQGGGFSNCWGNWHSMDSRYYYLPGDTIRMILHSPKPHFMQLQIEVLAISDWPESVALRAQHGWLPPENFFSPLFAAPGHGTDQPAEYKRVNAIDQVGNEGRPAIDTTSAVTQAVWHEMYLYRDIDGVKHRVPFHAGRYAVMNCPLEDRFTLREEGVDTRLGGSVIDIHPASSDFIPSASLPAVKPLREDDH
ncbi:MAG: DUF5011 domain-containing protein [Acholeplasmatales bacterium]|nr:MAG: DUF5011 domain-containing protein [Acholeplasmatales bacterium]